MVLARWEAFARGDDDAEEPDEFDPASRAKADGRFYGGKPKENCGLCFACVVRRGGVLAALGTDPTSYLVDNLPANSRAELIARRRSDINAIRSIVARGISEERLLAIGPFGEMRFDEAYDLVGRSLRELALVQPSSLNSGRL